MSSDVKRETGAIASFNLRLPKEQAERAEAARQKFAHGVMPMSAFFRLVIQLGLDTLEGVPYEAHDD